MLPFVGSRDFQFGIALIKVSNTGATEANPKPTFCAA